MPHYRSFLFPEAEVLEGSITLDRRESHHLVKVFRARTGESVEILDGCGKRYSGHLQRADAKAAVVEIEQVDAVERPKQKVTLLQALPKGKAMDLILRIATEIGVAELQPIYTSHSDVHIPRERVGGKVEKWRATTIEACKQCGLPFLPETNWPQGLVDWLQQNPPAENELRIVASLEEGSRLLLDTLSQSVLPDHIVLAVGPEGDFSSEEYEALGAGGFTPVRLGDNVLRAETAAAYMLSVIDQFSRWKQS
ncbi:16S rRNA methyltransferase [Coraliomargarita sinensis]|uniref:Ribosomal RNA small subunit methyltransferase E n=1 Tax=Coraliomargarita sinensis TaxID=2174842 RepID=A0A317ZP36_9BACT|nr:RsmE family RNA methyltransferase [Coraliomargarita sinensis]PXA05638.1 16S rRNA methyltransferase [Coraliomargarita sinensis]